MSEPIQGEHQRVRLVVVDDERLIGLAVRRLLRRTHDVTHFGAARDALDWLAEGNGVDVILTDIRMPGLDGPGFLAELERDHPELMPRVLLLTATPSHELPGGLAAWKARLIEKPFSAPALRERLDALTAELGRAT